MNNGPGEWKPADATAEINRRAKSDVLNLSLSLHSKERMEERGLIVADLLHLLKHGFVYQPPETATREGFFKYQIDGTTPNSDGRTLRAVVIPGNDASVKVVTIMWRDEK